MLQTHTHILQDNAIRPSFEAKTPKANRPSPLLVAVDQTAIIIMTSFIAKNSKRRSLRLLIIHYCYKIILLLLSLPIFTYMCTFLTSHRTTQYRFLVPKHFHFKDMRSCPFRCAIFVQSFQNFGTTRTFSSVKIGNAHPFLVTMTIIS